MKNAIEISLHSLGISVIDDIRRDDLFYLSLNPSKEIWIERTDLYLKPITHKLNISLEEHYQNYLRNPSRNNSYQIDEFRVREEEEEDLFERMNLLLSIVRKL